MCLKTCLVGTNELDWSDVVDGVVHNQQSNIEPKVVIAGNHCVKDLCKVFVNHGFLKHHRGAVNIYAQFIIVKGWSFALGTKSMQQSEAYHIFCLPVGRISCTKSTDVADCEVEIISHAACHFWWVIIFCKPFIDTVTCIQ